ncbi:MAG TPA: carboxypeptidase-like regulatory domain-containing protein [Polyangiaceae bacterium]|nr:carboxypeptidase-like regulatory domain-containing protein [Polyangiaceae bacterium]
MPVARRVQGRDRSDFVEAIASLFHASPPTGVERPALRGVASVALLASLSACGGAHSTPLDSTFAGGPEGGVAGSTTGASGGSGISVSLDGSVILLGGGPGASAGTDGGALDASATTSVVCDDAGVCSCPGNTTTITGFVYDPAGVNPLYNVSVYVPDPSSPLPDLDTVPLSCGCSQLYPATVLAAGPPTDATGAFQITCAPTGTVTLVVQTGKWRIEYPGITIVANQPNDVGNLRLPANSSQGSLPDIAISTGGADSLECLPLRIGVSASEYVLGSATGGHLHIYTGYHGATTAQGSVQSYQTLWDSQADLNQHDVVLLSCEGHETTGGNPGVALTATPQTYLMDYANAGGRVFASHFHYAWFNTGPFDTGADQLATWITGVQAIDDTVSFPGDIDTTLASGAAFPEGAALDQWLGVVGALTGSQLPIWFTRHNVSALVQPPSTEWIHLDPSVTAAPSATQYFSVDTPIGSTGASVCGRIVYSDLHVSGGPGVNEPGVPPDYPNPAGAGRAGAGGAMQGGIVPTGCAMHPLTPQEAALEFMLFDLSSCLVPIGQNTTPTPPTVVAPPIPR